MKKKVQAIEWALEHALYDDRKSAQAAFLAGDITLLGRTLKAGDLIGLEDQPSIRRGIPYAGKGGFKLSGALEDFALEVKERVCIDAGASTGGFTDCLVQRGAALVYAVDVGYGQLAGSLRQNPRVVNLEKTNLSDEKLLALSPTPDLGTVDLSYLSLRKAVPQFARILHGQGDLVCLVKPLFEIDDAAARRSGVIPENAYFPLLCSLIDDLNGMDGVTVFNATYSHVTGNAGTREFFLHLGLGDRKGSAPDLKDQLPLLVEQARGLEDYRK